MTRFAEFLRLPAGAVHSCSGDVAAPCCGAFAAAQVPELFSGKEVRADVTHTSLNAWLVTTMTHPSGVDDEAAGLGVLAERVVESGVGRVRLIDDRFHVCPVSVPDRVMCPTAGNP